MRQFAVKWYQMSRILFLLMLCCFLTSCADKKETADGTRYLVYYLDEDQTGLASEETYCSDVAQDMVKTLTELFQKLQTDSTDGKYKRPIPQGLEVNNFQIKENQLSVYFTAAYNNISGLEEVLSRAAVVKTLCQVDGIDYVEFYIEDQPLMINGTAVGLMSADHFMMTRQNRVSR